MEGTWTDAARARAFWLLCLPLRAIIAAAAVVTQPGSSERHAVALLLFGFGISQFFLHATNGRMDAPEGGGNTWWAPQRWMFGVVFISSASVAYIGPTNEWQGVPYADPVLGALTWLLLRPRRSEG